MRIATIGSRTLWDSDSQELIKQTLNEYLPHITQLVSGGAKGVDKIGEHWADQNKIPTLIFKPDWSLGRHAGMLRNTTIVENSDLVLAFWDGVSKGTMDSVKKARRLGVDVKLYHITKANDKELFETTSSIKLIK